MLLFARLTKLRSKKDVSRRENCLKQAVILAGGKGSRLSSRLNGLPKPMVDFDGKPLLWYQLRLLDKYGFDEVLILVNYLSDKIIEYVNQTDFGDMHVECVHEVSPLGTAGAVLSIYEKLHPTFLVVYGDTMLDVNLDRFTAYHYEKSECDVTLFVHPNSHPHDSDLVEVDDKSCVVAFHNYPHNAELYLQNLVNAALYMINRDCLLPMFNLEMNLLDFGKHIFPELLRLGIQIRAYNSPEYIKDCGTPDRLDSAIQDYKSGKILNARLDNPQKVIFLDRDGTINYDVGHLNNEKDLVLFDGVADAIKLINNSHYRCIIITNQPVIARGECSYADVQKIHNIIEMTIGAEGAFIDRFYFCPHHPDSGFENERAELKVLCKCRKPGTGLLDRASIDFNIDFSSSWFIGDTTVDIMTAKNCNLSSVLVQTGAAGMDGKFQVEADYTAPDLLRAVKLILAKDV